MSNNDTKILARAVEKNYLQSVYYSRNPMVHECAFCNETTEYSPNITHDKDCPVLIAKKILKDDNNE